MAQKSIEEQIGEINAKLDKILGLFEVSVKSGAKENAGQKEAPKELTGPEKLMELSKAQTDSESQ